MLIQLALNIPDYPNFEFILLFFSSASFDFD